MKRSELGPGLQESPAAFAPGLSTVHVGERHQHSLEALLDAGQELVPRLPLTGHSERDESVADPAKLLLELGPRGLEFMERAAKQHVGGGREGGILRATGEAALLGLNPLEQQSGLVEVALQGLGQRRGAPAQGRAHELLDDLIGDRRGIPRAGPSRIDARKRERHRREQDPPRL